MREQMQHEALNEYLEDRVKVVSWQASLSLEPIHYDSES